MKLFMFTGTLLLALGVDGGATERCLAPGGTSFKLSITSLRNVTRHWIVSVDAVTEHFRQATNPNSPVEVGINIGYSAVSCEQTEMVRLTATAVAAVRGVTETPQHSTTMNDVMEATSDVLLNITDTTSQETPPHSTAVDCVTAASSDVPPNITNTTSQETPTHSTAVNGMTEASSDVPPNITDTTSQAPPAGYEMVNGLGYYKMHTNALTWEQARENCVQEGAHLIIINSDREVEVVKTLLKRDRYKIKGSVYTASVWAGFHNSAIEGEYTTVLGEPLSSSGYTRWYSGAMHNDTEYNYGAIHEDSDLFLLTGDSTRAFICELIAQ